MPSQPSWEIIVLDNACSKFTRQLISKNKYWPGYLKLESVSIITTKDDFTIIRISGEPTCSKKSFSLKLMSIELTKISTFFWTSSSFKRARIWTILSRVLHEIYASNNINNEQILLGNKLKSKSTKAVELKRVINFSKRSGKRIKESNNSQMHNHLENRRPRIEKSLRNCGKKTRRDNLHKIVEHFWGWYHPLHLPPPAKLVCMDYAE